MKGEGYIHLPGIALDGDPIGVEGGTIRTLPFEEWCALDGSPFAREARRFAKARPAFWVGDLPEGSIASEPAIVAALNAITDRLHCCFLLDVRAPVLPAPDLSARYVRMRAADQPTARMAIIGPMEREWIVYGAPREFAYGAQDMERVRAVAGLLAVTDVAEAWDGVAAGIATLERTARPDVWWAGEDGVERASGFVQCIAACEGIVLASLEEREDGSITESFGLQAAVLTARPDADMGALSKSLADFYRLRSRLIHGRIAVRELGERELRLLGFGRLLLRDVVVAALAVGPLRADGEALPAFLARAAGDPAAHAALQARRAAIGD